MVDVLDLRVLINVDALHGPGCSCFPGPTMTLAVAELLNRYGDAHQLFVNIDAATRKQLASIAIAHTFGDGK